MPGGTLRFGSRGERVRRLQRRLQQLGYEPGPEDGLYHHLTFAAVRDLQRALRLPADGAANRRLLDALSDPELANLRAPVFVAELAPTLGPAAASRAVGRRARLLRGVSVPGSSSWRPEGAAKPDQKPPPVSDKGRDSEGRKEPELWRAFGVDDVDVLAGERAVDWQSVLYRRSDRERFVQGALAPFVEAGQGEDAARRPERLLVELGPVAWGDGGRVLHLLRRLRRELQSFGGGLVVALPLAVGGRRDGRSPWGRLDVAAVAKLAEFLVLVPPRVVNGKPGERPRGPRRKKEEERPDPRPPSPGELGAALREVVRHVPSWRCLLCVPLGAVVVDAERISDSVVVPPLPPTTVPYHEGLALAYAHRRRPRWDGDVGRASFRCIHRGRAVSVWLENRASLESKLALVEGRRLGGLYLRGLGTEDVRIWDVLRRPRTERA